MPDWYRQDKDELILLLHVQPNARSDEVTGLHDGRVRLRTSAPPVDGKANKHLRRYLAGEFGVRQNAVSLLSGESSRQKRVAIRSPQTLPAWFEKLKQQEQTSTGND